MKPSAVDVLWEDESLLVLRKPAGIAVIAERNNEAEPPLLTLMSEGRGRLFVVHRIDKETSGVLLLAKSRDAHARLNEAFRERTVSKTYLALAAGRPEWEESSCDLPLRAEGDREHRTVVDRHRGKDCLSRFRLHRSWGGRYCAILAMPETGRTHQIRVHLAALGLPIICDPLYGDGRPVLLSDFKPSRRGDPFDERPLLSRLGLHALSLELPLASLPGLAKADLSRGAFALLGEGASARVRFEAEPPKDIVALMRQLDKRFGPKPLRGGTAQDPASPMPELGAGESQNPGFSEKADT